MHPIAFYFGSLPIRWYGVMMALAFLAGLWTATRRARLANVSGDVIADVTLWLMAGSIVGARFVYVTTYWKQEFAGQPFSEIFMIQHGGLVYYGGLIGAATAGIFYLAWKNFPSGKSPTSWRRASRWAAFSGASAACSTAAATARACNLPWAISFPADNPLNPPTYPVHPTEIYDGLLNLILYFFWRGCFGAKNSTARFLRSYLMIYAVFRSIAEYFRGDYPADHVHAGLTSAQLVSAPIFIAGIVLWFWRSRQLEAKRG